MDKKRRGQITIFVIVGIMAVSAIFLVFFLRDWAPANSSSERDSVPEYVGRCLSESITDAIFFNSAQGGYFIPPDDSVKFGDYAYIPIYWDSDLGEKIPSLQDLEEQLGLAVKVSVENCVGDLGEFGRSYEIRIDEVKSVSVRIFEKKVSASIEFPIFLTKGGSTTEYKDFSEQIDFNLMGKYNVIKEAISVQKSYGNWVPVFKYSDIAEKNGATYEMIEIGEGVFLFSFMFDNGAVPEVKYLYTFASKYNWDNG